MPLFSYSLTRGSEARTVQLRKSNPQGWLIEAVRATFPDIAVKRANAIVRLRLEAVAAGSQTWHATLVDEPSNLLIYVVQTRT